MDLATNPTALGMVCLVLPGLLFFYTCRMQCRAKVGGLQQSLLSKGRGVCPSGSLSWKGWMKWLHFLTLLLERLERLFVRNGATFSIRHLAPSFFGRRGHTYRNVLNHKRIVLGKSFRVVFSIQVHFLSLFRVIQWCGAGGISFIWQDQPSNGKQLHLDKCCCLRSWQAFWSLCLVWSSLWWVQNLGRMNNWRIGGFWS